MKLKINYAIFAKLYPKKVRDSYSAILKFLGYHIDIESFIGFIIFFGIGLAIALSIYLYLAFKWKLYFQIPAYFIIFQIAIYSWLTLKADKKVRQIEIILPDALQLMSSNLRAGLTTDAALLLSAREEFGPFQVEVNRMGKEIASGRDIEDSMLALTKRVPSDRLEKTMYLITTGLKAGGSLADLLDETSSNLRNQRLVEEKVKSNVLLYVIFIFIAITAGAPMLFGLSSFLIQVLTQNLANIQLPEGDYANKIPIALHQVSISTSFVINYAIFSLITSSIFGSMIIGLISKGSAKEGLRYMPIITLLSVGVFLLVRFTVSSLLGDLFVFR